MVERSIYNMVTSIIGAVLTIPLFVLGIIFNALEHDILGIVLSSIFYTFIIIHFIFNSIYYAKEESTSKIVLYRLSKIITDIYTTLVCINFVLYLTGPMKWILFAYLITTTITEILLDSFDKLTELKYLLSAIKGFIGIFTILLLYNAGFLFMIGLLSILICYISPLLGNIIKNKIILSFDLLALILFGIFYIFI